MRARRRVAVVIGIAVIITGLLVAGAAAFTNQDGSSLSDKAVATLHDVQVKSAYIFNHSRGQNRIDAQAISVDANALLTPAGTTTTSASTSTSQSSTTASTTATTSPTTATTVAST